MRFQRGIGCTHPKRGRARKRYTMSEAALAQRCANLKRTRIRSDRESVSIRLLIWQSLFDGGPRRSQRTLARQLHVWPSYVCKIQKQKERGLEALATGRRFTLDNLAEARRFTERIREEGLLARSRRLCGNESRVMSADETIAEQWRRANEWKEKNPTTSRECLPL